MDTVLCIFRCVYNICISLSTYLPVYLSICLSVSEGAHANVYRHACMKVCFTKG